MFMLLIFSIWQQLKCHNLDVCEYYLVHMRSYEYVYRKTWYVKLIGENFWGNQLHPPNNYLRRGPLFFHSLNKT